MSLPERFFAPLVADSDENGKQAPSMPASETVEIDPHVNGRYIEMYYVEQSTTPAQKI